MSLVRVHNFAVSLDGFGTGEGQSLDAPFGHAGQRLHEWFVGTQAFQDIIGSGQSGTLGVDHALAAQFGPGIGAEIMGRGKYFPESRAWTHEEWRGWWGDNPPFHTPVFVLTDNELPPLEMEGGTTFHFVNASPDEALELAREAADGLDVRIGGGPTTVREFLEADLVDFMHVTVVPIVLGRGVRLWDNLEDLDQRFEIDTVASPSGVVHYMFQRKPR